MEHYLLSQLSSLEVASDFWHLLDHNYIDKKGSSKTVKEGKFAPPLPVRSTEPFTRYRLDLASPVIFSYVSACASASRNKEKRKVKTLFSVIALDINVFTPRADTS